MMRVTAAVIEREGRILIARRREDDRFGGIWEFPGGKIEPGEEPRDCLRREIREELELVIEVGASLGEFPYVSPLRSLILLAFRASILSGAPVLHDHSELAWPRPGDLSAFDFAEPDRPLVDRLLRASAHG
jgi:8-oxo-dGTP diphosphatase